ncbi:alpha/beta fold hydrolase [Gaetbulibacter sp. M235]|uniref:alpha/beta fold hydrolase n=1 Tax=Gaetbulibacter sp. M235 TaxID=3126510 RepID=UPI00374FC78F
MIKTQNKIKTHITKFKKIKVNGINIAYREAGNPENPTIVLLHGFPASSHQYRKVLNQLSDNFHLIAPDYPVFGNSEFPLPEQYNYTFDNIAKNHRFFLRIKRDKFICANDNKTTVRRLALELLHHIQSGLQPLSIKTVMHMRKV